MLNKDLKDIQLNLHQMESSINSVLEFIRKKGSESDKHEVQNAFLIMESALTKMLWKKDEVQKAKDEFNKLAK